MIYAVVGRGGKSGGTGLQVRLLLFVVGTFITMTSRLNGYR